MSLCFRRTKTQNESRFLIPKLIVRERNSKGHNRWSKRSGPKSTTTYTVVVTPEGSERMFGGYTRGFRTNVFFNDIFNVKLINEKVTPGDKWSKSKDLQTTGMGLVQYIG